MKKTLPLLGFLMMMLVSCQSVDLEKKVQQEMAEERKEQRMAREAEAREAEEARKAEELRIKEEEYQYDIEPAVITTTKYVVVKDSDLAKKTQGTTSADRSYQSMRESVVELKDYVGGTSYFDYDKDFQFPIFCKPLALTTIMLNEDEYMAEGSVPFMSDTTRWEIQGDVWQTEDGERQLVMLKPRESGLETNMLIVTNKRLYHFVLYSTNNTYQPMVEFRYPKEREFITSKTKKADPQAIVSVYDDADPDLLSFNYTMSIPIGSGKVDWIPEKVYDDGSHTYILLPEVCLQKEFPAVWEGSNQITNYVFDPEVHNLIIINKLLEKFTLRIGNRRVDVKKKKGAAKDMTEDPKTESDETEKTPLRARPVEE